MTFKYPLATATWDQKEIDAMQKVIASGNFTMGENVRLFEREFAKYIGSQHAVMVNSGSSANLLMIGALFYSKNPKLKLKRGDEVIVPAVSWSTTYYPLYQYGLKIKFVDIDIETLNYDLAQLESAISNKTRVVLAVNLLGNPNDFDFIDKIIQDKKIILLEDNCESMGATFNNKKAGTFGVMGTFSSFYSHHISTMEGGLIVTDDEEIQQILISLRSHGWTRDLPVKNLICGDKSDDLLEESFRFVLPGYNVRPLELEGALGVEQVKKLPMIISERRKNAKLFSDTLSNHPDLLIQKEVGASSWFGFSIIIRPGSDLTRKELVNKLNQLGFELRPIVTGNFLKNEVIKFFDYTVHDSLKNAEYLDKNGLFIGNHHYPIPKAFEALLSF
ncbi:DegT/DnrJ/EryC1/StrS family aminotransferase [Methylophilaceae bacterium]|jgi:CDP-4-dehydro-6-deoxyglucose reductase, E1|nr:DegT/DnrJ/EryC1/StrS family aminotransferase [Methylophilaceae bacterium]